MTNTVHTVHFRDKMSINQISTKTKITAVLIVWVVQAPICKVCISFSYSLFPLSISWFPPIILWLFCSPDFHFVHSANWHLLCSSPLHSIGSSLCSHPRSQSAHCPSASFHVSSLFRRFQWLHSICPYHSKIQILGILWRHSLVSASVLPSSSCFESAVLECFCCCFR